MQFFEEFKKFAVRGNMVDMAIGIIIGASFTKVVNSIVSDVLMPPIGLVIGGVDFSNLKLTLSSPIGKHEPVTINYGLFINSLVDFIIVAFVIFLVIKGMNILTEKMKKKEEPKMKTCPHCLMEIPYKAKKCGYCTSILNN